MNRKEFLRVTPESVGIPCSSINWLLDKLEEGWTEPHGLIIMRHGKICAEGWWSPFAPGIRHGLQSHTKTYAATAVGLAYTEGLVKLDERLIDIFPDKAPENPSENLKKLTVRDVLCMGCGMDTMPRPSLDWIREFLATPVNHVPGTAFMYNSTGSTLLGAIVREKTGLGLHDYLKSRLFDKIGINADNLRWSRMPDGMEIGGGGVAATTEDNLRLMKLYADGGVWEGERLLAEDYVKLATSNQNDSATERAVNPPAEDNFVGYGFQIWMCRPKGVYRADGAMGQFTIVVPDKDMLIAITETAAGSTGGVMPQRVLDTMWEFLKLVPDADVLPEDKDASDKLARRMKMLALPAENCAPWAAKRDDVDGTTWNIATGRLFIGNMMGLFMGGGRMPDGVSTISFKFTEDTLRLAFTQDGKDYKLNAALDGSRRYNKMEGSQLLVSASWDDDSTLRLVVRMIEGCGKQTFLFKFHGTTCDVEEEGGRGFFMGRKPDPILAVQK